jgi:nucleoside-diphosphate-sugar epimerase
MGSIGSPNDQLKVLVTGAAGFVGQELAAALLNDPKVSHITLTDIVEPTVPATASPSKGRARCVKADLASHEARESLFTPDLDCIYLLHGIMSGQSESDLELGLKVNVDTVRAVLDLLRRTNIGVKVVFPSSLAVYGPANDGEIISEKTVPMPQSSYGAEKFMMETLINDFSRRKLIDGRIFRLPTVIVRPGAPTGAASSFASGIIREPLKGERSVLPVSRDLRMYICSPWTLVKNLIIARDIPAQKFGPSRTVVLPGIASSVQDMLDALEQVGGKKALDLVEEKVDETTNRIVASWPADFDFSRATSLGFVPEGTLLENVQEYARRYVKG